MNKKFVKFFISYVVGYYFLITGIVALANFLYITLGYAFGYEFLVPNPTEGIIESVFASAFIRGLPNVLCIILSIIFIIYCKKIEKSIKNDPQNNPQIKIRTSRYIGNALLGILIIIDSSYHLLYSLCSLINSYLNLIAIKNLTTVIINTIILDSPTYILYLVCIIIGIIVVKKCRKHDFGLVKSGLDSAVRPEDEQNFT